MTLVRVEEVIVTAATALHVRWWEGSIQENM